MSTCEEEGEYTAYVTGTVAIDGADYRTKTQDVFDTAGVSEAVSIVYSGCQRTCTYDGGYGSADKPFLGSHFSPPRFISHLNI